MTLPENWWTTDLEDEPCDGCGVRPSKHKGHGSYTCEKCFNASWCRKCRYPLRRDHVCVTPEEHVAYVKFSREALAELGIEGIDDMLTKQEAKEQILWTLRDSKVTGVSDEEVAEVLAQWMMAHIELAKTSGVKTASYAEEDPKAQDQG